MVVLTEEQWAVLEPLVEICRPKGKTPPKHLRRTIEAIVWRHVNGAKWRAVPAELGPWWKAAQTFIRWSKLGVWQRLLEVAQGCAIQLGMAFLDGTSIRAHQKAAGAPKKGEARDSETRVKRLAARAAALAPKLASSLTARAVPSHSHLRPVKRTNCRWRPRCSIASPAWPPGLSAIVATVRIAFARGFGTAALVRQFQPRSMRPPLLAPTGFISTGTWWSGSGPD